MEDPVEGPRESGEWKSLAFAYAMIVVGAGVVVYGVIAG
ncbi:hypothetical protein OCOJLMKI_5153 [Methylobacterium iners]|jgi:hypothetical protein|uniref:Uncharacterized protein n=1 Tax=Methylobacterium iners TaxID=418707 RepID=A0ABQ4S4A4_9HYPH|nr:hypothetical protein OCOJLMKI_5153 [Methylobacterium iners]